MCSYMSIAPKPYVPYLSMSFFKKEVESTSRPLYPPYAQRHSRHIFCFWQ